MRTLPLSAAARHFALPLLLSLTSVPSFAVEENPLYRGLSASARLLALSTVQVTLETGASNESRFWSDPQGDGQGFVQPLRTFRIESGHYCREYIEAVSVGENRSIVLVACRDGDGVWKPANVKAP